MKKIKSISFVGSTPVAKHIYEESSKFGKRVQALGGAKNHLIVMPDANINQAVDGIIGAAFGSAGERCMAVSVAVAVGDIAEDLVNNINIKAQTLKVAPWTDESSDMGPVISSEHKNKIENYIDIGISEGANIILMEEIVRYKVMRMVILLDQQFLIMSLLICKFIKMKFLDQFCQLYVLKLMNKL